MIFPTYGLDHPDTSTWGRLPSASWTVLTHVHGKEHLPLHPPALQILLTGQVDAAPSPALPASETPPQSGTLTLPAEAYQAWLHQCAYLAQGTNSG